MQNLFDEVNSLDERCYKKFHLTEDILMEHAANSIATYIRNNFSTDKTILIVTGSGNNGADGITLGRILHQEYNVSLFFAKKPKSTMAILQEQRAKSIGVNIVQELIHTDIIIDAIVGSGFKNEFNEDLSKILKHINKTNAFKIACDIPSGIKHNSNPAKHCFVADVTITMGALKKSLFLDAAKDLVGKIEVADLGINRLIYEKKTNWFLLDKKDLKLPLRKQQNTHKGTFGHLNILSGQKSGASVLSAQAALRFGTGLVTIVSPKEILLPYEIMNSSTVSKNITAFALGMGLGIDFNNFDFIDKLDQNLPIVADADIFYMPILKKLLKRSNIIFTPHPKEFIELLKQTELANITIEELQQNRFFYTELFCKTYPNAVLLLKGANVIIGQEDIFYINPHGNSKLAKGGSGDILAGLIAALLAQGSKSIDAAINASLAHTQLALNYKGADFSLTPQDLILEIGNL